MTTQHEHEFEVAPGLPEALPAGERILWQGAPSWRALARRAFHARALAVYFAVILGIRLATLFSGEKLNASAFLVVGVLAALAVAAIGILLVIAYLASRTTLYTITNRRVVMRIGVVLCITFNLPFTSIASVGLRRYGDRTGDIPLTLKSPNKIAFVHLWPHARPWRLAQPEPMFRCVPEAARVGEILADAMAQATAQSRPTLVSSIGSPLPSEPRQGPSTRRPLVAVNS